MSVNKKEALELAKRVEGYINSDTLTENEKETIVSEAAAAYDENINSGWIPYRDEMSVDKLFTDSGYSSQATGMRRSSGQYMLSWTDTHSIRRM